jgi:hypothetical protein
VKRTIWLLPTSVRRLPSPIPGSRRHLVVVVFSLFLRRWCRWTDFDRGSACLVAPARVHVPTGKVGTGTNLSGYPCQLNRSTQHFHEAYSQEFEILEFFLGVDLIAAPLYPDLLAYGRRGQFSWGSIVLADQLKLTYLPRTLRVRSVHPGFERCRAFSSGSKGLNGSDPGALRRHLARKVSIESLSE